MQKIVPFKKDILFKTNIGEIVSISLDHELNINDNLVVGKFIISGEYKMLDTSVNNESFSYEIPFTVDLDEKYILDNAKVDIDDFYYEIINDNTLRIGIDVLVDNVEERAVVEERCVEEEDVMPKEEISLQKDTSEIITNENGETYKSYIVYIVRENDTIDDIIKRYGTSKEEVEKYNDLTMIKIGDKIIIPS